MSTYWSRRLHLSARSIRVRWRRSSEKVPTLAAEAVARGAATSYGAVEHSFYYVLLFAGEGASAVKTALWRLTVD